MMVFAGSLLAIIASTAAAREDAPPPAKTSTERAADLVDGLGADELGASFRLAARYLPTGPEDGSGERLHAVLQLVLDPAPKGAAGLEVTLLVEGEDGREVRHAHLDTAGLAGASPWVFLL
ncbi:MAG: hypothetical protein KDD11_11745, partial [Acidobacteria bacterium]|nr:hypothetical protein [Acidobacteriota bacterium]